jgi:hypothetical protein
MGTLCALATVAFIESEKSKKLDKFLFKDECTKNHSMPEKIINYETTDGEYLLRRNRLINFTISR